VSDGYWTKALQGRIGRRRALTLTGGSALGAAFIAACGGESGGSDKETGSQSLQAKPVDTLSKAKRGGVLKDRIHADVATFDPFTPNNTLNAVIGHAFSSFVQFEPGYMEPGQNKIGPDYAESWETSPDGLKIVFKLRQGVKFHDKPPVNGRAVDQEDVLFSWQRYSQKNTTRIAVANSASPQAPVLSITAPDSRTAVVSLNEPVAYALGLFANVYSAGITILPKETDSTFDIRKDVIGTGHYYLSQYTPSVGFVLSRNENYWDKDQTFPDRVEKPIISEYSSVLSQLIAGNIYSFGSYFSGPQIAGEDVIPTKRQQPNIQIYEGEMAAAGLIGARMSLGWLPEGQSPFLDERVRQAIALSFDRDIYLETFYNLSKFEAEGLPVETRYRTHLQPTFEGWWLDPQGKDFGPNARYFKHDVAEAKKLLTAAGYPNGFDTTSNYVTTPELSLTPKHAEVVDSMVRDIGIRSNVNAIDYTKEYVSAYRDGKGQYQGWSYTSVAGAPNGGSALLALANEFWSKASAPPYAGHSISGKNDQSGDPKLDSLIEAGRFERDLAKQKSIVFDIQRSLAKSWYSVPLPGMGRAFTVAWPVIGNFQVWRDTTRMNRYAWVDDSKPPLV
jgi:ABC-type transport system substrate-binding protein